MQKDIETAKEEKAKLSKTIADKEKGEEALRDELKKQKEDNTKENLKYNTLKKEF